MKVGQAFQPSISENTAISAQPPLGIVITAKQRGVIPAARPVLEQLRLC